MAANQIDTDTRRNNDSRVVDRRLSASRLETPRALRESQSIFTPERSVICKSVLDNGHFMILLLICCRAVARDSFDPPSRALRSPRNGAHHLNGLHQTNSQAASFAPTTGRASPNRHWPPWLLQFGPRPRQCRNRIGPGRNQFRAKQTRPPIASRITSPIEPVRLETATFTAVSPQVSAAGQPPVSLIRPAAEIR